METPEPKAADFLDRDGTLMEEVNYCADPAQVRENLTLAVRGPLPADLHRAALDAVPALSEQILSPRNWTQRMPDSVPAKR